jgi:HAD superfamily hydrolase (TIGR01509 family)
MKTLVLDAMGVIYAVAEDVAELLCPFIHENGGIADDARIEALYRDASLGRFPATEFWKQVQIDPALEDAYLLRHVLSPGLIEFLRTAHEHFGSVWCLSNDVSEWSRKLRERFELSRYIDGFVISGDVHFRKPDAEIYRCLLARAGIKAENAVFVDDRPRNLDAAATFGFQTVLFRPNGKVQSGHAVMTDFAPLLDYV